MSDGPEREQPREPPGTEAPPAESTPSRAESDDAWDDDAPSQPSQPAASEPEAASDPVTTEEPEKLEPVPDSTPLLSGDPAWGSAARSVTLGATIGFALGAWVELALQGRAASEFLASNALDMPRRMTMIKVCIAVAVLGAGLAGGSVAWMLRKGRSVGLIERWLWFLSPLILAPGLASVLHYKPWVNEHARLLPIVLLLAVVFEVLAFQALKAAPRQAREWWSDLVDQTPLLVRRHAPLALVVAGCIFYAAFFSFYLLRWHYKLRTGNFDLSINNNLLFGGLHGHFLESTVVFPQDPKKYLANHAKFGGYLFLPIYALYPKPETLLVLQSTLIGASGLPLFGFARRHLPEWWAAVVTLAYLAYYPMHGASFSEFQYVPIAGFFVLGAIWAAETRRWIPFALFIATGITMREDIPVGMALVGGFLLLSGHRPLPGLLMAAVSTAYFVVLRFYVMESAGDWWFPSMYKELWSDGEKGFGSVIKTLLSNPLFVLSKVLVEKKILYLLHLLVPLVFLPARRWYLWAAFIPGALLTLLVTNYDPPITFSFHYVMHWTPYLFVAAVLALEAIGKRSDFGLERRNAAALAMAASTAVLSYNYGAFPRRDGSFKGGFQRVEFGLRERDIERHERLMTLAAKIPRDASLAATEKIGPQVSSRVKMYTMRHGPQDAEYILASNRELKLSRTKVKLLEALRSNAYGVVERNGEFALFKRGYDTSGNDKLIHDWRLVDTPRSTHHEAPPAHEDHEGEPKAPEDEGAPEPRPE